MRMTASKSSLPRIIQFESNGESLCSADSSKQTRTSSQLLQRASMNEIFVVLQKKLMGRHYHAMRHAFNVFSPQRNGLVTRCALYRVLCNFVSGLTQQNFSLLLKRIALNEKEVVSFEEFFSKFRVVRKFESNWLCPIAHPVHSLPWQHAHAQLQGKAKESLSGFLSHFGSGQEVITMSGFRRLLNSLSLNLGNSQVDLLWKMYDTEIKGWITIPALLKHLHVCNTDTSILALCPNLFVDSVRVQLLQQLRRVDFSNCGKVTATQLLLALSKVGIFLTSVQLQDLLERLGFSTHRLINYHKFIALIASRKEGSLSHMAFTDKSSRGNGENNYVPKIVTLLHGKFLKLLASLKLYDVQNLGYIEEDDFKQCLRGFLTCDDGYLEELVATLCPSSSIKPLRKVPYPKFLAMLEEVHASSHHRPVSYPSCAELFKQITALVSEDGIAFKRHFIAVDDQNTGRLTFKQTLEVLFRCGVLTTKNQMLPLWDTLLKNKDGSVDFHQFVKEFSIASSEAHSRKRVTEDHCFMRSKTLHRDEDMLVDTLRYKLMHYRKSLSDHFASLDSDNSGHITVQFFQCALKELCPALTECELHHLTSRFQDKSGDVDYREMLSHTRFLRSGNNLGHLLSCQENSVAKCVSTALPLASKPNHGLPGVKADLQRQLIKMWKEMLRMFKNLDATNTGNISVSNFKTVLQSCGISFTSDDQCLILEALDPAISGFVNYQTFLNAIFDH